MSGSGTACCLHLVPPESIPPGRPAVVCGTRCLRRSRSPTAAPPLTTPCVILWFFLFFCFPDSRCPHQQNSSSPCWPWHWQWLLRRPVQGSPAKQATRAAAALSQPRCVRPHARNCVTPSRGVLLAGCTLRSAHTSVSAAAAHTRMRAYVHVHMPLCVVSC